MSIRQLLLRRSVAAHSPKVPPHSAFAAADRSFNLGRGRTGSGVFHRAVASLTFGRGGALSSVRRYAANSWAAQSPRPDLASAAGDGCARRLFFEQRRVAER